MIIEKSYKAGDDFVLLKVINPPLPEKIIAVSIDALTDGRLTLDGEIERETQAAQERLAKHEAISRMMTV